MKIGMLIALVSLGRLALATPQATVTKVETEGVSPEWVGVTYTLDADAVVTAEFFTDGVKVPEESVQRLYGDVNRRVSATGTGETRTFRWAAGAELGASRTVTRQGAQLSVRLTAWPLENPPLYMAVSLTATNVVRYYVSEAAVPGGVTNAHWKAGGMLLRHIYARNVTWLMGSPPRESSRGADETLHPVLLTKDFFLGVYPVTQRQARLAGNLRTGAPGTFEINADCDFYPLNAWGFSTITDYVLPRFRAITHVALALPSEAEWEFACRAGTTTPYDYGTTADATKMWYGNGGQLTTRVDRFPPNAWGLYGMHGGIREFCRDRYAAYPTTGETVVDPIGPLAEGNVITRGGSYAANAASCRSAARHQTSASAAEWDYGCRLMAPAEAK